MSGPARILDKNTDVTDESELTRWREAYRQHLMEKGLDAETAADIASKTTYQSSLFPGEDPSEDEADHTLVSLSEASQKEKPISRKESAIINSGIEIESSPPGNEDITYLHSLMCQIGMPRSPTEEREFLRQSGDAWIKIQAGTLDEGFGPVDQPLPSGPIPRLAMAWINTYAIKHGTPEIFVGHSAAEFLRNIGLDSGDGRRYSAFRKQMHALAASRIQFGYKGVTQNYPSIVNTFNAWSEGDEDNPQLQWTGLILLSKDYFTNLQKNATPLDRRALYALRGTAFGLDIYSWLANRLHRMQGKPVRLHWSSLMDQFGQEYQGESGRRNFKKQFKLTLKKVVAVYPTAKVKVVNGGISLAPSPPPVPKRLKNK